MSGTKRPARQTFEHHSLGAPIIPRTGFRRTPAAWAPDFSKSKEPAGARLPLLQRCALDYHEHRCAETKPIDDLICVATKEAGYGRRRPVSMARRSSSRPPGRSGSPQRQDPGGFAGATSDAFASSPRSKTRSKSSGTSAERPSVGQRLAVGQSLRQLEALLVVADKTAPIHLGTETSSSRTTHRRHRLGRSLRPGRGPALIQHTTCPQGR